MLYALVVSPAWAMDEATAVSLALQQDDFKQMISSSTSQAAARSQLAGLPGNPRLELERDSLSGAGEDRNSTSVWVRQPLDLRGVKALERQSARRAELAAGADNRHRVLIRQRDVRDAFYLALAAQMTSEQTARHASRLESLLTALQTRHKQGDVSQFDVLRMSQEANLVRRQHENAKTTEHTSKRSLAALISTHPGRLQGDLLPTVPETSQARQANETHVSLEAIRYRTEESRVLMEAASRKRWPDTTIGLGRQEESTVGGASNGVGLAIDIEFSFPGTTDANRAYAKAEMQHWQSEYAIALSQQQTERQNAMFRLQASRESALAFRDAGGSKGEALTSIAESAYEAGEITVSELIDAYETEYKTLEHYTDSALTARSAYIILQYLE
jgi:cobalt-zinc-cadmium efflux system outer membrane protein